ncbi:MAG TPA: formate dehydrogenase accessory sulfurtransferase FdhD [Isosphaeraceae bacterium]|jgi:FdhD protein|nr:formate dehydrogenase accessory sulfurtransferase FdhD [Isosphaeraceae bacterium]
MAGDVEVRGEAVRIADDRGASAAEVRARVVVVGPEGGEGREDWLAAEEPLEIRARGPGQEARSVAVTMRTPGDDVELGIGFLFTEGIIRDRAEVVAARPCGPRGAGRACNTVVVELARPFDDEGLKRHFFANSSCGVCGKATLDQVAIRTTLAAPGPVVSAATVLALPASLRRGQPVFDRTGGLHAAGLFDRDGRLLAVREDVGRHNAVDKLIGRALLDGLVPLSGRILLASGRAGFEIVQKAAVAGVPIVCAVSAPSSLAVAVAERCGVTLVGFLRGSGFNIYTHPERLGKSAEC